MPIVRFIMIEFHDRWRPDSSQAVRAALNRFDFQVVGENIVFVNNNIFSG